MLKADFHAHTNYNQKAETGYGPKELIDLAVSKCYDVLCLSEHYVYTKLGEYFPEYRKDPLASYHAFKDYAAEKGLLLIPAVEARYPEGEVLLVNFKGNVKDYPTLESLKGLPKSVLVIAPHPFFKRGICLRKHLVKNIGLFDAIEHSYYYVTGFNMNRKGIETAKEHSKPLVGTSDCHYLLQLGYTYSLVDAKKNADDIVIAVREGRVRLVTQPLPYWLFAWTTLCSSAKILFAYSKIPFILLFSRKAA